MSALATTKRAERHRKAAVALSVAFERAAREHAELQRLRSEHPKFPGLYFRLHNEEDKQHEHEG